jgi:hypothetical protein
MVPSAYDQALYAGLPTPSRPRRLDIIDSGPPQRKAGATAVGRGAGKVSSSMMANFVTAGRRQPQ